MVCSRVAYYEPGYNAADDEQSSERFSEVPEDRRIISDQLQKREMSVCS